MLKRSGLYAWGGPGTIRLLTVKYHSPTIDTESFLHIYDEDVLLHAKNILGITDMWVSFSWGFSDTTEKEDKDFILTRLSSFSRVGIRAHAYVQGLNVVTREFAGQDIFAKDGRGNLLSYSKGRSFTCPNNPKAIDLILKRVYEASLAPFAGVFIDNLLFGLPPTIVRRDFVSAFGCSCAYCQRAFKDQFGYTLPLFEKRGDEISDYLTFRATTIQTLIVTMQNIAHDHGKEFGVNLSDPYIQSDQLYYGYAFASIAPLLDYYLIENYKHPLRTPYGNSHLTSLIHSAKKPIFVVSYKKGIGRETEYSQHDLDAVYTESQALGYNPCYKATEFTTKGVWHALNLKNIHTFDTISFPIKTKPATYKALKKSSLIQRKTAPLLDRVYAPAVRAFHENKVIAGMVIGSGLYTKALSTENNFDATLF